MSEERKNGKDIKTTAEPTVCASLPKLWDASMAVLENRISEAWSKDSNMIEIFQILEDFNNYWQVLFVSSDVITKEMLADWQRMQDLVSACIENKEFFHDQ